MKGTRSATLSSRNLGRHGGVQRGPAEPSARRGGGVLYDAHAIALVDMRECMSKVDDNQDHVDIFEITKMNF